MDQDNDREPQKRSGRPSTRMLERPGQKHPEDQETPGISGQSDIDAGEDALEHGDMPESAVPDPRLQEEAKKGQQTGRSGQPRDSQGPGRA